MKKIDLKEIKKNEIKEKNVSDVGNSYDNLIKTYGYNSNKNFNKINKFTLTPVAKANKKYRFLKKYLRVKSTLEVGPGSGRFFQNYKKRNFNYIGVEASSLFFLHLKKKFKNKKTKFLNLTYPFKKNTHKKKYDLVFSFSSIQEKSFYKINSNFFIKKIITETYKILKANGLFIFDFFNYDKVDFKEKHLVYLKEKNILFFSKKFRSCKIEYLFKKNNYEGIVILKK